MSSPFHHSIPAQSLPNRPAAYHAPANAPPGTFLPGTKVTVGKHRVVIDRYLSEGGFAHVYLVKVPKDDGKTDVAVLKRVAVPDKEALANMRTEVETMKKLKGHRHIVTYIDSHASQLKGGGYEVFLLMEFCSGGGLIDFMNTRLQHRLTEPEILHIFSDVAEGVACMHYLKPPLLHRDLKVENVLITTVGSTRIYKLCDFGSTAPPRPAATTAAEGRLIEDDVQRHTTLQYRSPEMIDVYRKQPINEKSDIWALGVLLYKLCYYTTPFEEQGQMAILNATFRFPPYPPFSDRLKRLISWMLKEDPQNRPNIYQVMVEVCAMRKTPVPIKDIYSHRTASENRRNEQLPSPDSDIRSSPVIGIHKSPPVQQVQIIPEITPMRRGRPTVANHSPATKPNPSPMRTSHDPFAALDSASVSVRSAAADELAARFPSLDEFSILHDRGTKFQFADASPTVDPARDSISQKVTEALADEVFNVQSPTQPAEPVPQARPVPPAKTSTPLSRTASITKPSPPQPSEQPRPAEAAIYQPTPQRPQMVSTGTMTSPAPSPVPKYEDISKRPIWRVPQGESSQPRAIGQPQERESPRLKPEASLPPRPAMLELNRSKSQLDTLTLPMSPASSRPSLEGSRPSAMDFGDLLGRSKSANARPRPSSVHVESSLDYLRDRERESSRSRKPHRFDDESEFEEKNITSNVDFLRAMENDDSSRKKIKEQRTSSGGKQGHSKRSSLSSISLSGTKNILAGKFGDAFRRFESQQARTPSPERDVHRGRDDKSLTPIAGSEATDGHSDNEAALDETQELPPEVRRELERRRLSEEEKRVAAAAAEYRRRLAEGQAGGGAAAAAGSSSAKPPVPSTKASTIQNRVKSLLDESQKQTPIQRTAEGYGRYTAPAPPRDEEKHAHAVSVSVAEVSLNPQLPLRPSQQSQQQQQPPPPTSSQPLPTRKPTLPTTTPKPQQAAPPLQQQPQHAPSQSSRPSSSSAAGGTISMPPLQRTGSMGPPGSTGTAAPPPSRPSAPPKPKALRTGGSGTVSMGSDATFTGAGAGTGAPVVPRKPGSRGEGGFSSGGTTGGTTGGATAGGTQGEMEGGGILSDPEEWERQFSRRFPSLRGLEMVEREI